VTDRITDRRGKLLRYFFTAGAAAIVDVGGFAALGLTPLPIEVSAVASFCVATVVNYLLTSRYVFNQLPTLRGYGLFLVAAVGGLLVNVSVTLVGNLYLGIAPVLAKLIGVGTAFLVNFWLNLRVVFRANQGSM
jgi:putative flippase GtrA